MAVSIYLREGSKGGEEAGKFDIPSNEIGFCLFHISPELVFLVFSIVTSASHSLHTTYVIQLYGSSPATDPQYPFFFTVDSLCLAGE